MLNDETPTTLVDVASIAAIAVGTMAGAAAYDAARSFVSRLTQAKERSR